jgi:hypothetical protein
MRVGHDRVLSGRSNCRHSWTIPVASPTPGAARDSTRSITEYSAELAPMPNPRSTMITAVSAGALRICRYA